MNLLQINFRWCRHLTLNVAQTRKLSDKPGKSPVSPLLGYPVGIDIDDLDGNRVNKFAEVYRSAQEKLGEDFHVRAKDATRHYLSVSENTVKVRKLFEKSEEEVKQAIDLISAAPKPNPKRDFIQIGLQGVVNQLNALSKQYEELQKEEGH